MKTSNLVGGYDTYTTTINQETQDVFNQAFEGFVGVHYTPLVVSKQIVAGINYRFFCNAKGVYPNSQNQGAIVTIHQPLKGTAEVKNIDIV